MRQKFKLNTAFALYTNFVPNINFAMALYCQIIALFNSFNANFFNVKCLKLRQSKQHRASTMFEDYAAVKRGARFQKWPIKLPGFD